MTTQQLFRANNKKLLDKIMSEEIIYLRFTIYLN